MHCGKRKTGPGWCEKVVLAKKMPGFQFLNIFVVKIAHPDAAAFYQKQGRFCRIGYDRILFKGDQFHMLGSLVQQSIGAPFSEKPGGF